ncbi:hypothetical protein ACPOL_4335 [Acidisarcina polymorpha]|uniref:DinB-like domain-containing protein n=2 Tax=Acidisarcina polymorpha TaxID=2211140 RepID=A0A2Z5G3K8_9BACT|nr:hypothetical protein ACPOL_4335 [Acidisarcina polymorpha]
MGFVEEHPELLDVPCDVLDTGTVRALLHHIVMAELRYAQRLCGEVESDYEDVPQTVPAMISTHEGMKQRVERLLWRSIPSLSENHVF